MSPMDEEGTVLPAIALLVISGFLVLGLALDLGRWAATWRETAFAADTGAEAGAAMIDTAAAYGGELVLDGPLAGATAATAARRARPRPGRTTEVAVRPTEICVTVSQPFRPSILRALGIRTRTVTATACATPAQG